MTGTKMVFHACGTGGAVALLCFVFYINEVHASVWLKFVVAIGAVFAVIIQEWTDVTASDEPENLDGLLIVLAEILGVLIGLALSLLYWH